MRKHALSLTLALCLLITLPILVVQSQQLKTVRDILNDVWDRANHQLMGQPWVGGLASGQAMQTEQTIFNDVWDPPNHMLRVSSGGGPGGSGGPFNLITTGTNAGQTLTVGTGSILAPVATGIIKSTAWNTVPSPCGTNAFATGQDANGNMLCAQVPFTGLSGSAVDAQIPDLNVLSTGLIPSRCVETDTLGRLVSTAQACGTGNVSAAFNALTSGTNTTATMIVGPGGSIGPASATSGVVNANQFNGNTIIPAISGGTGLSAPTDDAVMIGNGSLWQAKVFPDCTQPNEAIHYNASTNTLTCDPISGTGGTTSFGTITSGTNTIATMLVGAGASISPSVATPGVINANQFNGSTVIPVASGGTGLTVPTDDTVMLGNGTLWQAKSIPDCQDVGGLHLNYTAATNTINCGSSGGTGSSSAFNALTSGTNTTAAMHVGAGASLDSTGGTIDATSLAGLAGSAYAKLAGGGQQVLTGTQIDNRVVTQDASSGAFTPNLDTTGIAFVPTLAAAVTVNAPSPATGGNPKSFHELTIVFQPTPAPRAITWNAIYSGVMGISLPTSTTGNGSTWDMVKFFYVPTVSQYVLAASTVGTEPGITTLGSSSIYTCPHLTSRSCEMQNTGAGGITIAVPSGGAPVNGKQLVLKVKCISLQNVTLDTGAGGFIASPNVPITGLTCPAAGPSWTAIGVEYSDVLAKWQVYATN